jgi:hypothetical protein
MSNARLASLDGRIAVVDVPGSAHARAISGCARIGQAQIEIVWISPDLTLPAKLRATRDVCAICIPLSIRRTTPQDRFLAELASALDELRAAGVRIFAAAGSHHARNLIADLSSVTSVSPIRRCRDRARLRCGDRGTGSSGASLRAAALYTLFLSRPRWGSRTR